jgi:protein-disulfide isomerase
MKEMIDPIRLNRRGLLGSLGASAAALGVIALSAPARAQGEEVLTEALVLRDPDIPVAGNAAGDISIVEYFDYQCPYCRKVEPELR